MSKACPKMIAAEIIYAALVWGEEGMLSMIGGLNDSDPYKAHVTNQWKQLRAYRRRRFGKENNPFEGCKTVTLEELRDISPTLIDRFQGKL